MPTKPRKATPKRGGHDVVVKAQAKKKRVSFVEENGVPESNDSSMEEPLEYPKGVFLAVLNDSGDFYLCQTLQEVRKTTERLKIRWLDIVKKTTSYRIYELSYTDKVVAGSILTAVILQTPKPNEYILSAQEIARANKIAKSHPVDSDDEADEDGSSAPNYEEDDRRDKNRTVVKRSSSGGLLGLGLLAPKNSQSRKLSSSEPPSKKALISTPNKASQVKTPKATPRRATPRKATTKKASPKTIAPTRATSNKASPVKTPKATKKKPTSKITTPKKATPKKATPKKTTPKKTMPKKASPKKASPKKASPKKASPKKVPKKATTKATSTKMQKVKKPAKLHAGKIKSKSKQNKGAKKLIKKRTAVDKKKDGKAVKTEATAAVKKRALHPNAKLTPKPDIVVVTKDPMLEVKNESEIPSVSPLVNSKRVIRAVLTKDLPLLKKLIKDVETRHLFTPRCEAIAKTALDYAIYTENIAAVKLLFSEYHNPSVKNRKNMPEPLLKAAGTGKYNFHSRGHATRAINVGRGCREGNNAFTKDLDWFNSDDDISPLCQAFKDGISLDTLKKMDLVKMNDHQSMYTCSQNVPNAVQQGHNELAGQVIQMCNTSQGFGFNKLHEEVLLATKPEDLSPFRPVSVLKMAYESNKIMPLHCAAINPNPKILLKLLSVNPQISSTDKNGRQPVHYAAACEGSGPLELILSRGVSAETEIPKTLIVPLHIAAQCGREQNIEVLLKKINIEKELLKEFEDKENISGQARLPATGVEKKNKEGDTAIHLAAANGHVDCVRCLVKHGASVESVNSAVNNKHTPLHIAARLGNFQLVKALIDELGAVIEKKDKIKRTALMLACMNGHYPVATLLLHKGADPNAKDSSGNTPVHYAAAYGWWHCLKLLLKAGGNPNIMNDWKVPPLGVAYLKGHFGCTDLLLEQPGVNVNYKDDEGKTMLLTTCQEFVAEDSLVMLKYLLKKGADVTVADVMSENAIFLLMTRNYEQKIDSCLEAMTELLDRGCDPSVKNNEGVTAIDQAIANGEPGTFRVLTSKGCRVELGPNSGGLTPLHIAARNSAQTDMQEIIKILAEMEVPMEMDEDSAATRNVTLEEAAKMEDNDGCTPFLTCIIHNAGQLGITTAHNDMKKPAGHAISDMAFDTLVDLCKSDINVRNSPKDGKFVYALHVLAVLPPCPTLERLLTFEPDLEVLDHDGYTPLLIAINSRQEQTARKLLTAGADPNGSVKYKHMAVLTAVKQNLPGIIPDLISKGGTITGSEFNNKQPSILHYIPSYIKDFQSMINLTKTLLKDHGDALLQSVDDNNRNILHNAVNIIQSNVTTEYLELLLNYDCDVYARDQFGRLPLHYAFVKFGKDCKSTLDPIEVVALLTDAMNGKRIDVQDIYGRTALHYASYRGAMVSAMHLVERVDSMNVEDNDGHTPLSMAVLNLKDSMTLWWIQRGSNIKKVVKLVDLEPSTRVDPAPSPAWIWKPLKEPSKPVPIGQTSLFQAVVHEGWQGSVYVLMDRIDKFGILYTEAIEAVFADQNFQLANEIIRKQRNTDKLGSVNHKDQNLLHLLTLNAQAGSPPELQVASSLLGKGVPLSATDYKGCTPLHYAAANHNSALCRLFASKDPDGYAKCLVLADNRGRVPLNSLCWGLKFSLDVESIIKLFSESKVDMSPAGPLPNVNLLRKTQANRCESLEEWYHDLPDDQTITATPLIIMALLNSVLGCKALLQHRADPNVADSDGVSPMMYAVMQNEISLVKVLLNHDYTPNVQTGMKQICAHSSQSSFPWAMNIWKQKKTGSFTRASSIYVDEGYVTDNSCDLTKVPKFKRTSSVALNERDSSGRTVIHYLMKTCDYGTYENVDILQLLATSGANLSLQDNQGNTPLDLAIENHGSRVMAAALQKLLKVQPPRRSYPKPVLPDWTDVDFASSKPDVDSDAQAMVEQLEAAQTITATDTDDDVTAKVDANSNMMLGGVVFMDTDQNIPYNIIMTKVDVQYGRYGMNNFYVMQIIHHVAKDVVVLFNRWGRIGDAGQFQKTPFGTKEDAIAEFKKIFKAKSGNDWANVKNFQKQSKKYMLVSSDPWRTKRSKALKDFQFKLDSTVSSKLPDIVQHVMREMTKPQTLTKALTDTGIDTSIMNFSHLPKDVLLKAMGLLDSIQKAIEESLNVKHNPDNTAYQTKMEEVVALSNDYFHLIPHEHFAFDKISPLTDTNLVTKSKEKLRNLLELEMTNRILLGATYRKDEINPLDYIYRALDCELKVMDEDDKETQLLLQHIHNSSQSNNHPRVQAIFRLRRKEEEERLAACKLPNHKLLWHGSGTSNLLSILKQGLLIKPRDARWSGSAYGEGIYTADTFAKSQCYWPCQKGISNFMLLCEVALGKMALNSTNDLRKENFKHDSVHVDAEPQINVKRELLLPSGALLPVGEIQHSSRSRGYYQYSEYVALREEQVCLRYLIQCDMN